MKREGSRFKIEPNPPVAGQALTITYVGSASEIELQVDGQAPVTLKPDKDGKAKVNSLSSGLELTLSDNLGIPGYLHARIVETMK